MACRPHRPFLGTAQRQPPPTRRVNLAVPRVTRLAIGGILRAARTTGFAQRFRPILDMSCYLRIGSPRLNIDRLLSRISLSPTRVFRRGERRFPGSKRLKEVLASSGANFQVSAAGLYDLKRQIRDAVGDLRSHRREILKMMRFPGIRTPTLDFGIGRRDEYVKSIVLPAELMLLAGSLGLEIEITEYPTTGKKPKSRRTER